MKLMGSIKKRKKCLADLSQTSVAKNEIYKKNDFFCCFEKIKILFCFSLKLKSADLNLKMSFPILLLLNRIRHLGIFRKKK